MKIKILYILLILFLSSCGYGPVYKNKQINFSISDIKIQNKNKISYKIKKNFNKFTKNNETKSFLVEIKSNKNVKIISKDKKGNPTAFELTINVELFVSENNNNYKKDFIEKISYKNRNNKFDLKTYETNITNKLVDNIILEINEYLYSLAQ